MVVVPVKPKPIEVPLTVQSAKAFVEKHANRDEPDEILDHMAEVAEAIFSAAQRVKDTHEKVLGNQMIPVIARQKQSKDAVFKIFDGVARRIDSTRAATESVLIKLANEFDPKPPKDAIEALYYQECRLALASVPEASRGKVVEQAIADQDDGYVSAALLGSPRLTGLGPAQRDALLDRYRRVRHADKVARVERLKGGLDSLDRVTVSFRAWVFGLHAENDVAIKAAEESERLAREALNNAA